MTCIFSLNMYVMKEENVKLQLKLTEHLDINVG